MILCVVSFEVLTLLLDILALSNFELLVHIYFDESVGLRASLTYAYGDS